MAVATALVSDLLLHGEFTRVVKNRHRPYEKHEKSTDQGMQEKSKRLRLLTTARQYFSIRVVLKNQYRGMGRAASASFLLSLNMPYSAFVVRGPFGAWLCVGRH